MMPALLTRMSSRSLEAINDLAADLIDSKEVKSSSRNEMGAWSGAKRVMSSMACSAFAFDRAAR